MVRTAVVSSNIAAIGYEAATKTLEVEFLPRNGRAALWQYCPVEQSVVDEMLKPGVSVGAIFHAMVKSDLAIERVDVTPSPVEGAA